MPSTITTGTLVLIGAACVAGWFAWRQVSDMIDDMIDEAFAFGDVPHIPDALDQPIKRRDAA